MENQSTIGFTLKIANPNNASCCGVCLLQSRQATKVRQFLSFFRHKFEFLNFIVHSSIKKKTKPSVSEKQDCY